MHLHASAKILHNDIKCDNVLLAEDKETSSHCKYHVVLTDFGKATPISQGRHYILSKSEKINYLRKCPHVAPEIVHGEKEQTTYSDMYAVGELFYKLMNYGCFSTLSHNLRKDLRRWNTTYDHQLFNVWKL